jgi:hypothetical protein
MKNIKLKKYFTREVAEKGIIFIAFIVLIYLLITLYFTKHFFFHTVINGVDVSLKSYRDAELVINNYIKGYELELIERNGETEVIKGSEIGFHYNSKNSISTVYQRQNKFHWISSLFKARNYYIKDLYVFHKDKLNNKLNKLNCLNNRIIEPQNVTFKYSNGSFEAVKEEYGNKIIKDNLFGEVEKFILLGKQMLDLDRQHCYENPKYTLSSAKTMNTKNLLNKYISASITYQFGSHKEVVDKNILKNWLKVDNDLEVVISQTALKNYMKRLSYQYDTVGTTRSFKASTGKMVEVEGGLYGWKIDREAEKKALEENIRQGSVVEREPIYIQRALSREKNEIGDTYIEINITRQHLWLYKDGKLITEGPVVTGNPNRGFATVVGTYFLNYKQKDSTLTGPGYEAKVTYWMPFYGSMGLHDATWRSSFGGEIYKRRGSHGCVNAPLYLAKKVFENVDEGIPIIIYEEKKDKN